MLYKCKFIYLFIFLIRNLTIVMYKICSDPMRYCTRYFLTIKTWKGLFNLDCSRNLRTNHMTLKFWIVLNNTSFELQLQSLSKLFSILFLKIRKLRESVEDFFSTYHLEKLKWSPWMSENKDICHVLAFFYRITCVSRGVY